MHHNLYITYINITYTITYTYIFIHIYIINLISFYSFLTASVQLKNIYLRTLQLDVYCFHQLFQQSLFVIFDGIGNANPAGLTCKLQLPAGPKPGIELGRGIDKGIQMYGIGEGHR